MVSTVSLSWIHFCNELVEDFNRISGYIKSPALHSYMTLNTVTISAAVLQKNHRIINHSDIESRGSQVQTLSRVLIMQTKIMC